MNIGKCYGLIAKQSNDAPLLAKAGDIFSCRMEDYNLILILIIIFTLLLIFFFISKKFGAFIAILNSFSSASNTEKFVNYFPEFVSNLPYLEECFRLSEQRLFEIMAGIQSLEKKALAIITGSLVLIAFIATKSWCPGITSYFGIAVIVSSLFSLFFAGFIITPAKVGLGGESPNVTVNYYLEDIEAIKKTGTLNNDNDIEIVEKCYLYLLMLARHQAAIEVSTQTAERKFNRFVGASYFMLVSFATAIIWLGLKLFPTIF